MNKPFATKIFLLLTSTFFTVSLFAQATRITQTIEMLPWLDEAVTDANQIEGGYHVYQDYSQMTSAANGIGLKSSRIKAGMLVTLLGGISGSESTTTLRLRPDFLPGGGIYPDLNDWTRVSGDGLIVNTLAERDALHDITGTDTNTTALEVGTIVIVVNDGSGNSAGYVFIGTGHSLDIDNDGIAGEANSNADAWFSLGGGAFGGGTTLGYFYFGKGLSAFNTAHATSTFTDYWDFDVSNWRTGSPPSSAAGTSFYGIRTVSGVTSAGDGSTDPTDNFHVFAFPKAWGVPSFYGEQGGGDLFLLHDLWQRYEVDVNGVTYYAYVTDTYVNPVDGGTNNFRIEIR